jgi:glycosyltransferase involved in cell wall biosynthesis
MREEMKELGFQSDKIELIPNSVKLPIDSRSEKRNVSQLSAAFRILYCGRLSSEKSLSTLLKAAYLLHLKKVPCEVHLVGGTYGGRDTTSDLKKLANELSGIKVFFHGVQKDVAKFYETADVFVLPSASEGMSNALLEALSYGLPCVASDIVPNRTLITDGINGLLFKQGDAEALAKKLLLLAEDQQSSGQLSLQLGSEARNRIQANYSTELICQKLNHIYQVNLDEEKRVQSVW